MYVHPFQQPTANRSVDPQTTTLLPSTSQAHQEHSRPSGIGDRGGGASGEITERAEERNAEYRGRAHECLKGLSGSTSLSGSRLETDIACAQASTAGAFR